VVINAHKTSGCEITVSVRDTGIGIHESDHESIFKSFEKVATAGLQSGGVGLGLPLAKRIVEMHGSKLLVESELDLGSTFYFKLKISKDQTLAVPLPTVSRQMIRRADFSKPAQPEKDIPKLRSDEGTGVLFLEDTETTTSLVTARISQDTVELVGLLGQAQHNIRRIGTRLSVLEPEEIVSQPELLERLMGIDSLCRYIDERLPEVGAEGEYRQQLVTLMRSTLHIWEVTTQKSKIELAEESNIWAVSIDDGRLRTRTFDRYLRLEHLPKIPRWREVVRTAYFVLSNPSIEVETRASLEKGLERTKAILKRAAIN